MVADKGGEMLEEVSLTSEAGEELKDIIRESYLDGEFDSRWLPAKIQLISSKTLQSAYEEKREECIVRGRTSEELADQYGFTVENNISALQNVCNAGFNTHDSDYNALGYSCMGVYLCRHADVCLRHAVVKYSGSPVIRLVVCKYMLGRHTTAIPRVASSADFIQPTQGFDCHVSVLPPTKSDSLQSQFDRSQVYVYDINALLQPLLRPRQLLPYAVVTYTLDGSLASLDDTEPLKSDIPPQLQHIIQRINAKAEGHVSVAAQRPSLDNFSHASAVPSSHAASTTSVVGAGSVGGKKSEVEVVGDGSEANLQRVIAQINARLESQERSKQLAVHTAAGAAAAGTQLAAGAQSDIYLSAAAAGRVAGRSVGESLGVVGPAAARVDPTAAAAAAAGALGILPTGESVAGLAGYGGHLAAAAAAAQPKITVTAAANMAGASGGYMALTAGGRSAPFAMAPELVGSNMALAGLHYPSSASLVSASPYLRTLPGMMDAASVAALDSATMLASQQLKYIPYQSAAQSRDIPVVGTASAGGLYPLQSVVPADAVGAGYTLVNSAGSGLKRPLNDVMLYMVDKRPRYY